MISTIDQIVEKEKKTEDSTPVDLQEIDSVRNMVKNQDSEGQEGPFDPLAANQRQSGVLIH